MNTKLSSLLVALFLVSGCSTVKGGLVGEERENVTPFAEASIELMTLAKLDFRAADLVYLRKFYDSNADSSQALARTLDRIDDYRDDIVSYSLELVRISQVNPTDDAKCMALADLVDGNATEGFIADYGIDPDENAAFADMLRGQTNFLECLRTLQPLVVRSGEAFDEMAVQAESVLVPEMVALLDASIEREYATVLKQLDIVYERRDELFKGLQAIRAYRKGDGEALRALGSSTAVTDPAYKLPASPSDAQLQRTKNHIIELLQMEEAILDLLARDEEDFIATHAELEAEEREILDGLHFARRQVAAWVRAHEDLANGVRDPGRWLKGIMQVVDTYRRVK